MQVKKHFYFKNEKKNNKIVTKSDRLYCWGYNPYGQLGDGDLHDKMTPTLIPLPDGEKPIFLSYAYFHAICITQNHKYYVLGNDDYSQLTTVKRSTPTLLNIPNNDKMSYLNCGYYRSLYITLEGQCYAWGNTDSVLAINKRQNKQDVPTILDVNGKKLSIVEFGSGHAMALDLENNLYVWGCKKLIFFFLNFL